MISLPIDSTVIDFAYAIHTQVGHRMIGAKVDNKMVSIDHKIQTGEIIEILTSNNENHGPSRSWLDIAKTNEARSKIRSWFKKERREENIVEGKAELEREFKRNFIHVPEGDLEDFLSADMKRHNCDSLDSFYAAVGYGGVQLHKVIRRLKDAYNKKYEKPREIDKSNFDIQLSTSKSNSSGIIVDGIGDCLVKFAACCSPLPGDDVVGFITKGHGISVHKRDCVNFINQTKSEENRQRWVSVHWAEDRNTSYFRTTLDVVAYDRIGLLADISNVLAAIKIPMHEAVARELKNGNANVIVTISVAGKEQLDNVIGRLKKIDSVISVDRTGK